MKDWEWTDKNGCVVKVERPDEAAECFQVMFTLQSALRFVHIYLSVASIFSRPSCTSHLFQIGGLCLYVYVLKCPILWDVFVFCVKVYSVCVCMCQCVLSELISTATKCCYVLLLFSCCHRNTVVAKLLLLPCYFISCSLFFPQWLRIRPRLSSHNTSSPYRLLAVLQQPGLEERSSQLTDT